MAPRSVDAFLNTRQRWKGGAPCSTCRLKNRKAIDRACLKYLKAVDDEKTSVPLKTFVDKFVKPEFDFPSDYRALQRHLENCLGKKIGR